MALSDMTAVNFVRLGGSGSGYSQCNYLRNVILDTPSVVRHIRSGDAEGAIRRAVQEGAPNTHATRHIIAQLISDGAGLEYNERQPVSPVEVLRAEQRRLELEGSIPPPPRTASSNRSVEPTPGFGPMRLPPPSTDYKDGPPAPTQEEETAARVAAIELREVPAPVRRLPGVGIVLSGWRIPKDRMLVGYPEDPPERWALLEMA